MNLTRMLVRGNDVMSLLDEVAGSEGREAYADTGKWFGRSNDTGLQTRTRHVGDTCFLEMWGNDIVIRPE